MAVLDLVVVTTRSGSPVKHQLPLGDENISMTSNVALKNETLHVKTWTRVKIERRHDIALVRSC